MELSKPTQITDHSSERYYAELLEDSDDPVDDLTAILKAKDQMIKTLQLGNLCFKKKADYLEGKVQDLKNALEAASYRFSGINQVLGIVSQGVLSSEELYGVILVVRRLGDEGESEVNHDLAMADIAETELSESDAED